MYLHTGKEMLIKKNSIINEFTITADSFENAKCKTVLVKVQQAYILS